MYPNTIEKMRYALLIGANYYSDPSVQLNGCIDDINNMKALLVNHFGYDPANITMLHDDVNDPNVLPTKANMLLQLNNLMTASNSAEEIWIHYSGHGSQISKVIGTQAVGVDNCIVPIDYQTQGFIIDDDLFRIFSKAKCPTIILMDSCHSGTVCELPYTVEYLYGNVFKQTRTNRINMDNKNIYMLSGCKDWQTSADIQDTTDNEFEGAFTDSVIKSLQASNYNIDIKTLLKNVCNWLSSKQYTQQPIMSSSNPSPTWQFSIYVPPVITNPAQTIKLNFTSTVPSLQVKNSMKYSVVGVSIPTTAETNALLKRFHLF
jgi:metacaspase-1